MSCVSRDVRLFLLKNSYSHELITELATQSLNCFNCIARAQQALDEWLHQG